MDLRSTSEAHFLRFGLFRPKSEKSGPGGVKTVSRREKSHHCSTCGHRRIWARSASPLSKGPLLLHGGAAWAREVTDFRHDWGPPFSRSRGFRVALPFSWMIFGRFNLFWSSVIEWFVYPMLPTFLCIFLSVAEKRGRPGWFELGKSRIVLGRF